MLKTVMILGVIAIMPLSETGSIETCKCNDAKFEKKDGLVYDKTTNTTFTGNCIEFYQVQRISQLKKKKIPGNVISFIHDRKAINMYMSGEKVARDEYYSDGTLAAKLLYKGKSPMGFSLMQGIQQNWYQSGILQFQGSFDKGMPTGIWNYYNHKGQHSDIIKVISTESSENNSGFHFTSKIEGETFTYNENGSKSGSKKFRGTISDEGGLRITEYLSSGNTNQPGKIK